jgi:ABC-type glycerol-3-phosphate transport system substrate-binding protein
LVCFEVDWNVPKKAVFIFFLLAFLGAALFIFFTFPRTRDEIPKSNNQRSFPSAPGPNNIPVPETVPHPDQPAPQHGPTLRVMAWAGSDEVKALRAEADAFEAATGHRASLTIEGDTATYQHDLQQALASNTPPDVCLIGARDFSGIDPARDLANVTPAAGTAPRSITAFSVGGMIKAVPDEFSVDVLFYNPDHFDRAGIGYPDRHWNWDILEAMSRALVSLNLKDGSGQPVYPLELPADFDFWNVLCTQAGHPALDLDVWHLSDAESKGSQMRALDFIREVFHEMTITAPLQKVHAPPGRLFAQQRASLLIAPSELTASLPRFRYAFTLLPGDISRASLARVNGWAVTAKSSQPEAAQALALFLARQPVHVGWSSVQNPADTTSSQAICYEALGQAVIPRIEPKTVPLAQFLDQQIDLLARNSQQTTDTLYARIQTEYQNGFAPQVKNVLPQAAGLKASPTAEIRGL